MIIININVFLICPSPLKFPDQILIQNICVYTAIIEPALILRFYWHKPVCKSLQLKIFLQSQSIIMISGYKINGPLPVIMRKNIHYNQLTLKN